MAEWSQSDNHSNVRLMFNQHWRPGVTVSSLVIQRVNKSHNGIFQCGPSNSEAKTIKVHVLEGEIILKLTIPETLILVPALGLTFSSKL